MKKETEHCDVCGTRVDLIDADGDKHINGIRLAGALRAQSNTHSAVACYSSSVAEFGLEVVCGPTCLENGLYALLKEIKDKWPRQKLLWNDERDSQ